MIGTTSERGKVSRFWERFESQAAAEDKHEQAQQHAYIAAELASLQRETAEKLAILEPKKARQHAAYQKQLAASDAALMALGAVQGEIFNVKHRAHNQGARLESQLALVADPRIDAAIQSLSARVDALRKSGITTEDRRPTRETLGGPAWERYSNLRALERVLKAAMAARHQLEALKLVVVDDLDGAIAAIDASVPWADLTTLESIGPSAA